MSAWRCDHITTEAAHIDAGPELTDAVLDRRSPRRRCEINVLATASGRDVPSWRQLGVLVFELGQRAIATVPRVGIDHDHGSGREADVGVGPRAPPIGDTIGVGRRLSDAMRHHWVLAWAGAVTALRAGANKADAILPHRPNRKHRQLACGKIESGGDELGHGRRLERDGVA